MLKLESSYTPAGDQPKAIKALIEGIKKGTRDQVLLGVTGSGKSVVADTPVMIRTGKNAKCLPIGPFIDSLLSENAERAHYVGDTLVLDNPPVCIEVYSINPHTGAQEWRKVTQLTRHSSPHILYKVRTQCGRSVTVTGDHNFFALRNGNLKLCDTISLKTKDYLPVPRSVPSVANDLESVSISDVLLQNGGRPYYVPMQNQAGYMRDVLPRLSYQKRYHVQKCGEAVSIAETAKILTTTVLATLSMPSTALAW